VTIFSQSAVLGPQNRGNRYAVVGTVSQFNGLVQLSLSDPSVVFDLGFEGDPAPVTASVPEFNTNGLVYQSRVIRIENLNYVSGTWAVGQNVVLQDSFANQITVRIQVGSTAGQPTYPVTLTGIGGQFDSTSPFNSGYQLQPRDQADAPANPPIITSSLTATANAGSPFSYQITATDNPPPTFYDADPLPGGLSINSATGLVSGSPSLSGIFNVEISATNTGGTVTETLQLSVGESDPYDTWAGGAPLDQANLLKYAIGGASGPSATDGVAPVTGITATDLSLTAIVRTNDPNLATVGTALTDLLGGTWSTEGVTITPDEDQDGVPEGCERQIFSTPRGEDGKKFLRLQSTLGQP
jgi:hypothetical protein